MSIERYEHTRSFVRDSTGKVENTDLIDGKVVMSLEEYERLTDYLPVPATEDGEISLDDLVYFSGYRDSAGYDVQPIEIGDFGYVTGGINSPIDEYEILLDNGYSVSLFRDEFSKVKP